MLKKLGIRPFDAKKFGIALLVLILALTIFFNLVIWVFSFGLPGPQDIGNINIDESTTIKDSKENILYKVQGDIRRTLIDIEELPEYLPNAFIAIEDQDFYKHSGISVFSILNGTILNLIRGERIRGGSTITQQLAKNAFLSSQRTVTRKVREAILANRLESIYNKQEILELYVNYIPFGGVVYGVEEAALWLFGKNASEVDILESSILASLPAGTSSFSPYRNRDRLMGYCKGEENLFSDELPSSFIIEFEAIGDVWVQSKVDDDEESFLLSAGNKKIYEVFRSGDFFFGNLNLKVTINGQEVKNLTRNFVVDQNYVASKGLAKAPDISEDDLSDCSSIFDSNYVKGRKDLVLISMYELGMISEEERDQAWKEGRNYKFRPDKSGIKAPHFVFYVIDQLEEKFGKDLVEKGGLQVITTLDPDLQEFAEDAVFSTVESNKNLLGANNAALISVDPEDGRIISMVGSKDYLDDEIDGKVNIILSPRQPGSSFKSFIYAAAFQRGELSSGSVLWDVPAKIGNDDPGNYDGLFIGPTSVRKALAYSRNIPAAKAYFYAGEENYILNFIESLGITQLTNYKQEMIDKYGSDFSFGWPISLGTAEIRPIDLAAAYSVFANNGVKQPFYSILEVKDSQGNILYKHTPKSGDRVLDPRVAYMANQILADNSARPEGWNNLLSVYGKAIAVKTGTSNKKKGGTNLPSNAWVAGYTPEVLTVVWGGNSDGTAMSPRASGYSVAGPIWNAYMNKALEDKTKGFEVPSGIVFKDINKLSGLLATDTTPKQLIVSEPFMKEFVPDKIDTSVSFVEVDKRNNLLATELCDQDQVVSRPYLRVVQESDRFPDWQISAIEWMNSNKQFFLDLGILPGRPSSESPLCSNDGIAGRAGDSLYLFFMSPENEGIVKGPFVDLVFDALNAPNNIELVQVYVNGSKKITSRQFPLNAKLKVSDYSKGEILKIRGEIIDSNNNIYAKEIDVEVSDVDLIPPVLRIESFPTQIGSDENLSFSIKVYDKQSEVSKLKLTIQGIGDWVYDSDIPTEVVIPVSKYDKNQSVYTLFIEAVDSENNSSFIQKDFSISD